MRRTKRQRNPRDLSSHHKAQGPVVQCLGTYVSLYFRRILTVTIPKLHAATPLVDPALVELARKRSKAKAVTAGMEKNPTHRVFAAAVLTTYNATSTLSSRDDDHWSRLQTHLCFPKLEVGMLEHGCIISLEPVS